MAQAGIEQDMEMFLDDQRNGAIRAIKNDMVERGSRTNKKQFKPLA
jgi:hypothetical protein